MLKLIIISLLVISLSGCISRELATRKTSVTPKECWDIFDFRVKKYRRGKTTDGQLAVWLAREGIQRKREIGKSVVCAIHAIKSDSKLSDEDKKHMIDRLNRKHNEYKASINQKPGRRVSPDF